MSDVDHQDLTQSYYPFSGKIIKIKKLVQKNWDTCHTNDAYGFILFI